MGEPLQVTDRKSFLFKPHPSNDNRNLSILVPPPLDYNQNSIAPNTLPHG